MIKDEYQNSFNFKFELVSTPDELKIADIVPIFKKEDQNDKTNYGPIGLLPLMSKNLKNLFISRLKFFLIRFYY